MTVSSMRMGYHVACDMAALSAFYRDALGLAPRFADGSRWAEFQAGASRFALAAPQEAPRDARGAVLVFACDDLDGIRTQVLAHGGRVLDQRDMGSHGRIVTAADPAGTVFQLFAR